MTDRDSDNSDLLRTFYHGNTTLKGTYYAFPHFILSYIILQCQV